MKNIFVLFLISVNIINMPAQNKKIKILFTHDLHSNFLPHKKLSDKGEVIAVGGYAKLAFLIEQEISLCPENTLILDAGDFAMGTLFHTNFEEHASELILMGAIGYDATTFGNHDFDFHPEGLANALFSAQKSGVKLPKIISSNIEFPEKGLDSLKKAFNNYPVKDYIVIKKNNLKIALFGLMGKDAAVDAPFAKPLKFTDTVKTAKRIIKILKEKEEPDVIICLSHCGTNSIKRFSEDEILAKKIPEIDLIISGHTHTILPKPIIIGKTIIVSAGCYSEYLGVIEADFINNNRLEMQKYELKQITEEIPEDNKISKLITRYKEFIDKNYLVKFNLSFDEPISETDYNAEIILNKKRKDNGLGNLITDSYRYAVSQIEKEKYEHISLVIEPTGNIRNSLFKGKISVSDIFSILSLGLGLDKTAGYPLISIYLSGKELKQICEIESSISQFKNDAHLEISGVKFSYSLKKPLFFRVTDIYIKNKFNTFEPLDNKKLYRVVLNYYTGQMVEFLRKASFGILKIIPKDKDRRAIIDLKKAIIFEKENDELKEWEALTIYLKSFPDTNQNGLPYVPLFYSKSDGRIFIK